MKKFFLAALAALPLTLLGQQHASAETCCTPLYRVGISLGLVFRGWCGCDYGTCTTKKHCHHHGHHRHGCHSCLAPQDGIVRCGPTAFPGGGPWYGYWPHPAHFRSPAPTGYPYWPAPLTWTGHAAAPMTGPATYASLPVTDHSGTTVPMSANFGGFPMNPGIQPAAYQMAPGYWFAGR